MSNVEHLIENAIFAMKRGENLDEVLDSPLNAEMLEESGISKEDMIRMAEHVVIGLYENRFPYDPSYDVEPDETKAAREIVERFEDLLDKYNITIPSDEDDLKEPGNTARLYGMVYWNLLDQVEEIIQNYI